MAGKQFTRCVPRDQFDGMCGVLPDLWYMLAYGAFGALMGAILGLILGAGATQVFPNITDAQFQCFLLAGAVAGFLYGAAEGLQELREPAAHLHLAGRVRRRPHRLPQDGAEQGVPGGDR